MVEKFREGQTKPKKTPKSEPKEEPKEGAQQF
jgi:hypothetical protein